MRYSTPIRCSIYAFVAPILFVTACSAADLTVSMGDAAPDTIMPDRHAFCPPNGTNPANISPAVTWSAGPEGTRSYALRMQDQDVPAALDQIEKPGVVIARDAPRIAVDHWILADIPADRRSLAEGEDSDGFTKGGKPTGPTSHGVRGANVYASFFASKPDMVGPYGGYDGPCPPRNDERPHRYTVKVFALDIEQLALPEGFTGDVLADAMRGHILAEGSVTTTYSRWEGPK
ncbi:YbhB/YbcL family Raf kinase inhibitor-like protein [Jiella mangrovi]|uniref:YbhB/YbcL family Raf kinase inhibitor-like protein n=1 Tax=Jiella mangrovi TaxID=2821407 RepID=A0ABS4BFT0_9HYPH|nr:YbhB/YbcL family Raf kinase inhibitor-like protein [Jiella mangrovi]MBP0614899.1 YbhB/YbcL family Raf kinase inhibitor-like protein [Jiella mangrovi]